MYVCMSAYVCMDGWMGGWMGGCVDGWMGGWVDGWVDGWMDDVCMYGPVFRIPESVSLGDYTMGGGQEREFGGPYHGGWGQGSGIRTHIYIYLNI